MIFLTRNFNFGIVKYFCRKVYATTSNYWLSGTDVSHVTPKNNQQKWKQKRLKYMYNILRLIKRGENEKADEIFHSMLESRRVRPDTAIYNAIIKAHANTGDIKSAFKLFNDLKKRNLSPSYHTYSTMFGACSKAGPKAVSILHKLISEIDRRDVKLNTVSYNAQLSALVHCGLVDKVFETFSSSQMPSSSIETFGILLLAAAKDTSGDGLDKAVHIWKEMLNQFQPSLHCYNTLLLCLREASIPNHMTQSSDHVTVIPHIKEEHSQKFIKASRMVSLKLYNMQCEDKFVMNLYLSDNARWIEQETAHKLLKLMKSHGVHPDIRTYSFLSSLMLDFQYLLQMAKKSEIEVDRHMLMSASQLRRICHDTEGAMAIAAQARQLSSTRDTSLHSLAKLCKNQEDMMKLLVHMKSTDSLNDMDVWSVLVTTCIGQRDYKCLHALLKEMKYNEIVPSNKIINSLQKTIVDPPKNRWLQLSFNGFKGYYTIWSKSFIDNINNIEYKQ